jgi:putative redox protein
MELELKEPVKVSVGDENYLTHIKMRHHKIVADEPETLGGKDEGATPYELLLASLGSCTVITLKMYSQNKKWDLHKVNAELNLFSEVVDGQKKTTIFRNISLEGNLDETQKERLLQIAKACPVAKILAGKIEVESKLKQ